MFSDITPAKIGFIGLGLIGGSVAKAIRTYFPDYELIAFDKNKETLALAVQENIIDTSCSAIDDNFKGCSYIFLCAPVSYNTACLTQLKSLIDPDCILTDVGSVKTSIHEEIISLGMEENFIGGHPMAGREHSGFTYAKKSLFNNASMIFTPTKGPIESMEKLKKLFTSIGFTNIEIATPEEHDRKIAFTSQLAHVVSNAYIKSPTAQEHMGFSAGSYKDLTRVAKLNEDMWTELFLENPDNLADEIDTLIENLQEYSWAIRENDSETLRQLLKDGREKKAIIDGEIF